MRALTALLQSEERDLQIAALKAIQQCGPSAATALPVLLEFGVTASDTDLRDEAFLTAGHLGEAAVDDLISLLDAEQAESRRRVRWRSAGWEPRASPPCRRCNTSFRILTRRAFLGD